MIIDINTVLIVTVCNIVGLAIAAPSIMGRELGTAANAARWSLIVQAAGWVCMIFSNLWPETLLDRLLSTAAIAGFSATSWLMFNALQHWLGPRRFVRSTTLLSIIIPVGYILMFSSYALRVGWANLLLALQMVLVAQACFAPKTPLHGHWRLVVAVGMSATAVLTLGRGILGAFTSLYPSFLTPHPWNIAAMMMASLATVAVNFAILGGWHEEAEVALRNQAITDTLTGLLNRRGWHQVGRPLLANARRNALPVALLMIDIDYFKKINDSLGHDAGDQALRAFGRLLRENTRHDDVAARIGGEEFCLLLAGSSVDAACNVDQKLRARLPELMLQLLHPLDFSSGLAIHQPGETLEQLMMRADAGLYEAKQAGRGQLKIHPGSVSSHRQTSPA